jgi:hypothetical protein
MDMEDIGNWLAEVLSYFSLRRVVGRLGRDMANWNDIRAVSPLAVLAGLNCVAGLLLLRAQGGAANFKMSDARLCVAAAVAAGLAMASRWVLSNCQRAEPAFWIKVLLAAFSVLPLAALFIAATPRNSILAVSFVCALAVLAGNVNLLWKKKSSHSKTEEGLKLYESSREATHAKREPRLAAPAVAGRIGRFAAVETERPKPAEWSERTTGEAGQTIVRGSILARFEAGQSLATVHIPFHPPFTVVPEFTFEAVDAGAVRVRTPAVFRYGARLELKRNDQSDEAWQTSVRFQAVSAEPVARAA